MMQFIIQELNSEFNSNIKGPLDTQQLINDYQQKEQEKLKLSFNESLQQQLLSGESQTIPLPQYCYTYYFEKSDVYSLIVIEYDKARVLFNSQNKKQQQQLSQDIKQLQESDIRNVLKYFSSLNSNEFKIELEDKADKVGQENASISIVQIILNFLKEQNPQQNVEQDNNDTFINSGAQFIEYIFDKYKM